MRLWFTVWLSLLLFDSFGQIVDHPGRFSFFNSYPEINEDQHTSFSYRTEKQKKLVIKGNLVFTTYSLVMSPVEIEISDLEALECEALLKRDTATLIKLWARDFTLGDPKNKLVTGSNYLPYYVYLSRMVEAFNAIDNNLVYTSGYESLQTIKPDGSLEDPVKRNYFHTWIRTFGVWKLSTKTHGNP